MGLDEILDSKLYLGNVFSAENLKLLQLKGITHILVAGGPPLEPVFSNNFTYFQIFVEDQEDQDMLEVLDSCFDFLDKSLSVEENKVFVHCAGGVSRSATVTIAYLMRLNEWKLSKAINEVRICRGIIAPNSSFLKQLELFEKWNFKVDKYSLEFQEKKYLEKTNYTSLFDIQWNAPPNSIKKI